VVSASLTPVWVASPRTRTRTRTRARAAAHGLVALCASLAGVLGCRGHARAPSAPAGTACERSRGRFRVADVDAPGAAPGVLALARQSVVGERWEITRAALEVRAAEGASASHEDARVERDGAARCTLELSRGTRRRMLNLEPAGDGRVRAYAEGTPVGLVLQREP
jgi:hypothetical protein